MSQPDQLKELHDKVRDMIKMTKKEKRSKERISKELVEKLLNLESEIKLFNSLNILTFQSMDIKDEMIEKGRADIEKSGQKEKKTVQETEKLLEEVDQITDQFAEEAAKEQKKIDAGRKEGIKRRKKKFRNVGGQADWRPL